MTAGFDLRGPQELHRVPLLSVIVPTLNERDNVPILFERLSDVLGQMPWEMIIVDDDSTDGTWNWARHKGATDARLRCLRRIDRRGLAGACIEGALFSSAQTVAVLDGDLQHDETILATMWRLIADRHADLVIGTRFNRGGIDESMSDPRRWLSNAGAVLSRIILKRAITDPMSGFFMIRRDLIENIAPCLVADGFKILVDILLHVPCDVRVAEVAYDFRERGGGHSKLDARVLVDYAGLLIHRLSGNLVPVRMTAYLLVGLAGLVTHLVLLRSMINVIPQVGFNTMEIMASYGAMPVNFLLNNVLTFRERRVRGWAMAPALVLFGAVCSVGVLANLSVATWILAGMPRWWLAGFLGALVSAFWNYAVSAVVVWPLKSRSVLPVCSSMPKTRPPYGPEFRRQMVNLVRASRDQTELAREWWSPRSTAEPGGLEMDTTDTTKRYVVGGIDTHKDLQVAAVVDERDRVLGSQSFSTTRQGYRQMLAWMGSFVEVQRIGIESTGSYETGLLRFVQKAGVEVLEVTTPKRHDRRRRGK